MSYATPPEGIEGPIGGGEYQVVEGDCIESIAARAGFFWETIWNDPQNASVKQGRVSKNVLLPGDQIHIREKILKTLDRPTEQRHKFVKKGTLSKLRICVKQSGEPQCNQPYILEIDGNKRQGQTDEGGWVEETIPAKASGGKLTVGASPLHQQVFVLQLGGMDPVTEVVGVQKRLHNLGFTCEPTGKMDAATSAAIAAFQKSHDLEATGDVDRKTLDIAKKEHGS